MPFDRQPAGVGNGTMVALNARSVQHIRQLHALALSLGGVDEGAPDHRRSTDKDSIVLMYAIQMAISWRLYSMPMRVEHQTDSFRVVYESGDAPDIVRR